MQSQAKPNRSESSFAKGTSAEASVTQSEANSETEQVFTGEHGRNGKFSVFRAAFQHSSTLRNPFSKKNQDEALLIGFP
jgi:hypothetical protein